MFEIYLEIQPLVIVYEGFMAECFSTRVNFGRLFGAHLQLKDPQESPFSKRYIQEPTLI